MLPSEECTMSKKQHAIKLTPHERRELEKFVTSGKQSARAMTPLGSCCSLRTGTR